MKARANYHIHTEHSDGGSTVSEVVKGLAREGVASFSITDHDCVKGNLEAERLAAAYGLQFFHGVELSCCFAGEGGLDYSCVCHIVGLGIDSEKMQEKLFEISKNKQERLIAFAERLIADGYSIEDALLTESITSRTDIATALKIGGYVKTINEGFALLNSEKYVVYAKNIPTISEGIDIIHDCGGMALWAHPYNYTAGGKRDIGKEQAENALEKMKRYGLDGIEVFYQKFDVEKIHSLKSLAKKYDMLMSVGTDFHGIDIENPMYDIYKKHLKNEKLFFEKEGITPAETITEALLLSARQ